jgi:hypothetical protein
MRKCIGFVVLALAVATLALPTPAAHAGPRVGSSQSDQSSNKRAFSITNNSSCTITYTIWWTNSTNTAQATLAPGRGATCSYGPDSNGDFQKPHISFRAEVGGKTDTVYDLDDSAVTDGQKGKLYEFKDTGRNTIDLFKQ